jgi:hypothetical protein
MSAMSAHATGRSPATVGDSDSPTTLLTYADPVAHDPVTLAFHQSIGANDPLRSGGYSKTLTFTLSTPDP